MAEKLCNLGMIEWHSEPTRQDVDQKRTKNKTKQNKTKTGGKKAKNF